MRYHTDGVRELEEVEELVAYLQSKEVTVGKLFKLVMCFADLKLTTPNSALSAFDYVLMNA